MQLKYLKFDVAIAGVPVEPVVIAFSKRLVHKDVAERLTMAIIREFDTIEVTLASGGFVDITSAEVSGDSESCKVTNHQDDCSLFV